jgi:hypothetical protein
LFLFNQFGDRERCLLRPGSTHGAAGWHDVLAIARYRGKVFRSHRQAVAAFAIPGVREFPETGGIKNAIRIPNNRVSQPRFGYLPNRPVGRPSNHVCRFRANFTYQAGSRPPGHLTA